MTAIYAILLFLLMITPHELGHLMVAKAVGVQVNEFAVGMGPAIFKKQKGETLYSLRLFPLGGYCAMEGENEESDNERAFNNRPPLAKIAVLLAGAFMNVATALVIMIIIAWSVGTPTTTIDKVIPDGPAAQVGVMSLDKVEKINGESMEDWNEIISTIQSTKGKIALEVKRGGEKLTFDITPSIGDKGQPIIGINTKIEKAPGKAIVNGTKATYEMGSAMLSAMKQLVTGQVSLKEVAGPVGMVSMVGQTGKLGFVYVASLIALVSLNLAIINLLPLPALDGGRILFVFIRQFTGKMITDELEGKIHTIGLMLLLGLAVLVTWNDIGRLIK